MENRFVLDTHMHTIVSGHAYGTIREMAQSASEKGMKLIGITEHGPGIPGTCDVLYFASVKMVPKFLYGVEVIHGSELNIDSDGHLITNNSKFFDRLDYWIAGIHCVNGLYVNQDIEKNTDNIINVMKEEKLKIISHPDTDDTPLNYERLAKAAKEYGVALEVNNSSIINKRRRPGCEENYVKMLKECMKYKTNVILNSDAHDPSYIGGFDEVIKIIDDVKFDYDLILNTDVDKFKKFINYGG